MLALISSKENSETFILKTTVDELIIENNQIIGVKTNKGETYYAKTIILAPGREGQKQFIDFTKKYGIKATYSYIDVIRCF